MLSFFRKLSVIEGLSLILLLLIALPLRRFASIDVVWPVGMTHGLLWLSYFVLSLPVSHKQKWSVGFWLLVLLSSVTPFGFLLLDRKLRQ